MRHDIYHTVSGQRDPTAGAALSNLIGEERRQRRMQEKKLNAITDRKRNGRAIRPLKKEKEEWTLYTDAADETYHELAGAVIATAYRDYVRVLRQLESIPEPDIPADEKTIMKTLSATPLIVFSIWFS